MLNYKKIWMVFFLLVTLIYFSSFSTPLATAKADDDLVINYDGSVTLVITGNSVLAAQTQTSSAPSTPAPSKPNTAPATPAPKIIPVVVPSSSSTTTVKIAPSTTSNKKLNITIQTKSALVPTPVTSTAPGRSTTAPHASNLPQTSSIPSISPSNTQTVEKTVDNVILQDASQKPVLTITPDQNQTNQVQIKQQDVNVSTNLPIEIDTKTHAVSVDTTSGKVPVSILPDQAVKGADNNINSSLPTTKSSVSLKSEDNQTEYVVSEERKGKLLGLINITIPSQVKISAQTGRTIYAWQSPVAFLSFLIK